jgi:hypothetical protein
VVDQRQIGSRTRGGDTQLVVVNPTFILGPALTTEVRSSLQLTKMMLDVGCSAFSGQLN